MCVRLVAFVLIKIAVHVDWLDHVQSMKLMHINL